jgi:hypothetical protein
MPIRAVLALEYVVPPLKRMALSSIYYEKDKKQGNYSLVDCDFRDWMN